MIKRTAAAFVASALMLSAGSAAASTIQLNYQGNLGSPAGSISPRSGNIYAGEFEFSASNNNTGIVEWNDGLSAFCIEIETTLQGSALYEYVGGLDNVAFRDVNRENDIRALFNLFYSDNHSAQESRAFQIALWELIYEGEGNLSVSSGAGYFYVASGFGSGTVGLANNWLAALGDWDGTDAWSFHVLQNEGSQNLLTVRPVPTPAALGLLLAGLGGLLVVRRRRHG